MYTKYNQLSKRTFTFTNNINTPKLKPTPFFNKPTLKTKVPAQPLHFQCLTNFETPNTPDHNLVFLHGLLGSHRNWRQVSTKLLKRAQIPTRAYLLDLRNHGRSIQTSDMTIQHLADDLNDFINTAGLADKPTTFIGLSMGGKAAMLHLLQNPNENHSIVSLDVAPASYIGVHNHDIRLHAMSQIPLEKITSRAEADKILAKFIDSKSERLYLLSNLQKDDDGKFSWSVNLESIIKNQNEILDFPSIDKKSDSAALFLSGAKSHYLADRFIQEAKDKFPQSEVEIVPHAGHFIHIDQPELFLSYVDNFISQRRMAQ